MFLGQHFPSSATGIGCQHAAVLANEPLCGCMKVDNGPGPQVRILDTCGCANSTKGLVQAGLKTLLLKTKQGLSWILPGHIQITSGRASDTMYECPCFTHKRLYQMNYTCQFRKMTSQKPHFRWWLDISPIHELTVNAHTVCVLGLFFVCLLCTWFVLCMLHATLSACNM